MREDIYKSVNPNQHHTSSFQQELRQLESEAFGMTPNEEFSVRPSMAKEPYQLHQSYIICPVKSGMMMIDQQAAHERILYETYLENLNNGEFVTQKELFPRSIDLEPSKSQLLKSILPKVNALGFEMEEFGHHTFIIHGLHLA
ncbi:MAG: hypothetical protein U0T36_05590 [Saprospiraceae bacterium]